MKKTITLTRKQKPTLILKRKVDKVKQRGSKYAKM